jgi:hypothetical protein
MRHLGISGHALFDAGQAFPTEGNERSDFARAARAQPPGDLSRLTRPRQMSGDDEGDGRWRHAKRLRNLCGGLFSKPQPGDLPTGANSGWS